MRQIINQQDRQVKTFSQVPSFDVTTPKNHKSLCVEKDDRHKMHRTMDAACQSFNYKAMIDLLVDCLVNHCNADGETRISYASLAYFLKCSIATIKNYLNALEKDGLISRKKNGWQKTNTTILLPLKTKLNHKELKFSSDLNQDLNLRDRDLNKHYNDYESFLNNQEKRAKKYASPPPHPNASPSKHINAHKLNGPEKETEINRACLAWLLSVEDTRYVHSVMGGKLNLSNPAAFLASMLRGISQGKWSKVLPRGPEPEWREVEKMNQYQAMQPETQEEYIMSEKVKLLLSEALQSLRCTND